MGRFALAVPALSLTTQAFLLTIALGPVSSRFSRLLTSSLGVVTAFFSLHLLTRHRQAEVTDAHWLAQYEKQHFGVTAHGPNASTIPVVYAAKADGWHAYVKPAAIYFGQGGAPFLAQLHWSPWNGTSAWATGKLLTQKLGCSPSYKCP